MKIEFLHHYNLRRGLSLRDRLIGYLPRYAPLAARFAPLSNLSQAIPGAKRLGERWLGLARARKLPLWRRDIFRAGDHATRNPDGPEVVLLPDTFTTYFEPENGEAALAVLEAAGYRVHVAEAAGGGRPLCCGRTFLAVGLVEEARKEMRRLLSALLPFVARGLKVVGLEPSCLLTLRDELTVLRLGEEAQALAGAAVLFEEFLAAEAKAHHLALPLKALASAKALVHGHCHQKAFAAMPALEETLRLVPGLAVETIASSCCGMAGAFGYQAETHEVSLKMAELSLLPAVRAASADTLLVACGTSCRRQIGDLSGREAVHVARVLAAALERGAHDA